MRQIFKYVGYVLLVGLGLPAAFALGVSAADSFVWGRRTFRAMAVLYGLLLLLLGSSWFREEIEHPVLWTLFLLAILVLFICGRYCAGAG